MTPVLHGKWAKCSTFTVEEVAEICKISRWLAYEAAKNGTLATVRIGRRHIVPRAALEQFLSGGAAQPATAT
jgi:excisionase family DNA binding protein